MKSNCRMNNDEKWCLRWDEFDRNIREYFSSLRKDGRMFDVTLATEDGQQIQAHRIILSAGSKFFSDIFFNGHHSNILVYLKGIRIAQLESLIDFIYSGEAFITQEYLKLFLEAGKELQVKGLQGELQGVQDNKVVEQRMTRYNNEDDKLNNSDIDQDFEDLSDGNMPLNSIDMNIEDTNISQETNSLLDNQIKGMIEKQEGTWKCKVCSRISTTIQGIKRHAETHIEGMSHICQICSKTFPNRNGLQVHISNIHSQLISCDVCGRKGMNKIAYRKHKCQKN